MGLSLFTLMWRRHAGDDQFAPAVSSTVKFPLSDSEPCAGLSISGVADRRVNEGLELPGHNFNGSQKCVS